MTAQFNIPSPVKSNAKDVEWESLDITSLPPVLAKQVTTIHEAEQTIKALKAQFAEAFNSSYSVPVPDGMVRRFSFKFDGLSFGNAVPNTKNGKAKVTFTAKKGK
jgi:hypothetical protein